VVPLGTPFAFASNRDGRVAVYVADGEGAQPVRLAEYGFNPDWSVDDRIAFERAGVGGWAQGIYVTSAFGGGDRYVGPGENPSWSPDGRFLAVTRNEHPYVNNILSILDVEGGNPPRDIYPRIWSDPNLRGWVWAQYAIGPAWSPDGRSIAFSGCSGVGHPWDWPSTCGRLWQVTIKGDQGDQVETELADGSAPSWSKDGQLAFESDDWIYVRGASAGGSVLARGITPDWTPDGRVVFAAQMPGDTGFRLVVLENGTPRRILPEGTGSQASYQDWQVTVRPR